MWAYEYECELNVTVRVGLWLKGNPLVVPPATVWKASLTEPIWAHLRALELEKVDNLQPLKIVLLGASSPAQPKSDIR